LKNSQKAELSNMLYKEHEQLERVGNKAGALEKLKQAAELGLPSVISALAYEYYNNYPDKINDALNLYRLAAKRGDYISAWNLARHYEMRENAKLYFLWLNKASQMGMDEAREELSNPFPFLVKKAKEFILVKDIAKARSLLQFAVKHGSECAREILSTL
jgi:TPR repeat protein